MHKIKVKRIGSGYLAKSENKMLSWANPEMGGEPGGMMLTIRHPDGNIEWRYYRHPDEALADARAEALAKAVILAWVYGN